MDYAFIRRRIEEDTVTLLICKDRDTRAIRAHALQFKGTCLDEAASKAAQAVSSYGYNGKIAIKCDNEPALLDLRNEVVAKLPVGVLPSKPPPMESQSNRSIETGVRTFKGVLRVHLFALERKINSHVSTAHPLMKWLVEHVADVVTKYFQGNDGKSAYNRLFGKHVHGEGFEFGVLDPRWEPGTWLGRSWGTTLHRVMVSSKKVIEVRSVQRVPKPERWDSGVLNDLVATPSRWTIADDDVEPTVVFRLAQAQVEPPQVEPQLYNPRRVFLTQSDFERFGFTTNCRRCDKTLQGRSVHGMAHNQQCRDRMESKLRDAGDPRILRAEDRKNQEIARRVGEAKAPQGEERGVGSDDLPQPQGEPTRLFPRHGPLKGSPSDVKESDFQRRPDGGYDNIVEPQPENQPRRRTGMDPENDDSFALFPEDDSEDMEMLNFGSVGYAGTSGQRLHQHLRSTIGARGF